MKGRALSVLSCGPSVPSRLAGVLTGTNDGFLVKSSLREGSFHLGDDLNAI